jgi:hypothetical protein
MTIINKIKFTKKIPKQQEKILNAAAEVFTQKGVDGATIEEIADRANVGKGTIYRQIGNKQDIVEQLFKEGIRITIKTIENEIKKRTDPLLQFKEAIYAICEVYEDYSDLTVLLFENIEQISCSKICKGGLEKSPTLGNDMLSLFGIFENILKKSIKKKQIKSIDTSAFTMGIFHLLDPHFYWYLRNERFYTKGEIAQYTIDLFLNGIKNKK